MKKFICALSFAFLLMVGVTNVNAAGNLDSLLKVFDAAGNNVTCDGCLNLGQYVAKVPEGGTLQLQGDITSADNLTDSLRLDSTSVKNMTLDLNGHKISSSNGPAIIIGSETTKVTVTVKGGTVVSTKNSEDVIKVFNGSNLNVTDCKIYYKDVEANSENTLLTEATNPYITGIHVGDNSKVNITDTTIYANYAVWVNGSNSNVTINKSDLHGYAALDISNGASNKNANRTAKNNKVTVNESTLKGHNPYSNQPDNNYGTVVVGGQEGLELTITKSTITNTTTNNTEDLILFSDAYADSINSEVNISESKLDNTDNTNGSAVFKYDTIALASNNSVISTGTTITGIQYPTNGNFVYVSVVYSENGVTKEETKGYIKGNVKEELKAYLDELSNRLKAQNIKVEGYYSDSNYKSIFDLEGITNNTKVYVKTSKIVVNDNVAAESNPDTSDINLYLLLSLIAVSGCGIAYTIKKRFN